MNLLILKTKNDYLRFKDEQPYIDTLDKASVFPMDQLEKVQRLKKRSTEAGFNDVHIKKLVLTEENI